MAEPITIQLTFTTPLNGTGDIALERNNLTVTNGRLYTATVPSGSRLNPDLFSLVSAGSVKSVAISASTHCPTDVARVYVGSTVRTEIDLRGRHQTVTFGPGEQLAFVTHGPTTVTLVVNELSEAEHAARVEPVIAFPSRIRLSRSDGSGFAPGGVLTPALTWNETARMFTADVSTNGSIPLEVLDPRESRFAGLTTRVRLSGFDGEFASVGRTDAVNGETHFVAQVAVGQWSPPFQLSHDDLLALETPALRAGCTSCVADIELLPGREAAVVVSTAAASAGSTVAAGTVPRSAWIDRSVNAAGATPREDGWLLWTHAITGNPNAAGNKGFHGTGAGNKGILSTSYADELPLGDLQSLVIRYASLTAGNDSALNTPYVNLVIDFAGDGSQIQIGVMSINSNANLNLLTQATVGTANEHEYTLTWVGNRIQVVNELAGVTPVEDEGAGWLNKVYAFGDILAQYPSTRIVRAFPADNGLPAGLVMPGLSLVIGDSNYQRYSKVLVRTVEVNGA